MAATSMADGPRAAGGRPRRSAHRDALPQRHGPAVGARDLHEQHVAAVGDAAHRAQPQRSARADRAPARVDLPLADQAGAALGLRREANRAGDLRRLAALLGDLARDDSVAPRRSLRSGRALRALGTLLPVPACSTVRNVSHRRTLRHGGPRRNLRTGAPPPAKPCARLPPADPCGPAPPVDPCGPSSGAGGGLTPRPVIPPIALASAGSAGSTVRLAARMPVTGGTNRTATLQLPPRGTVAPVHSSAVSLKPPAPGPPMVAALMASGAEPRLRTAIVRSRLREPVAVSSKSAVPTPT